MKTPAMRRRHFNLTALSLWLTAMINPTRVDAQQQVITSRGEGMEGEVVSTDPHRPRNSRAQPAPAYANAPPPPGSVAAAVILIVGDSISAEYGLPRGKGWVSLLQMKLQTERPDLRVINASVSGDTTAGGRSRLPALLEQYRPVQVVIELGGNDALRGLDLSASQNNLQAMIEASRVVNARVVLLGMQVPPNYGPDYGAKFATLYANLARQYKTGLVPFFLKGIADVPNANELFQPDRIHPNEQAQSKLLNNAWPEMKRNL
jgi:acyl-CoA thioesterase-1